MNSQQLTQTIAQLAYDKKASDVVALDVRELVNYTDYFIVCTGRSDRQVKAIHDNVREVMKHEFKRTPDRAEGEQEARWVLLDYGDCVLHVMTPEMREFYRLEELWGDAPELELVLQDDAPVAEIG